MKACATVSLFRYTILILSMLFLGKASALQAETISYTLQCGAYRILAGRDGHRIEMEGCDNLMEPGKPLLPAKNVLIALPPGARVQSVEIEAMGGTELPGSYHIVPAPPIVPLVDPSCSAGQGRRLLDEWRANQQEVYSTDQPYPEERGELKGSGTLRKYSYASVSFYPFSFCPQSGRLIHFDAAQIVIAYRLPAPGSAEAERVKELMWDTVADKRASRLFVNFQQIQSLYRAEGSKPTSWQETYDYVIITPDELLGAITASAFPAWKDSLGHQMVIVLIVDSKIAEQPGRDLAERIRTFLRENYGPWGVEHVLLVGDWASNPMRYCFPDSANHSFYPYDPFVYGGEVPTDYYYADLSSPDTVSWDSDGDGFFGEYGQDNPDFLAEVSVGRIPTSDSAQITYTLNKLVSFERDVGAWKNRALHGGAILFFENQDYSDYPRVDGATCLNQIEAELMDGWIISHYSERAGLDPSLYLWPALSEAAFVEDWRNGQYGVVNWAGHGAAISASRSIWSWDDGDGVPESAEIAMPNFMNNSSDVDDDYPSIVFAISCLVGYPESNSYGRLGVDLLTRPSWGASAGVISATRGAAVAGDWLTTGGGAESLCYEFNRYLIDGPSGPERVGDALYDSKFHCHQHYGWDHYYEFKNMFDYNLYGDPSLAREGASVGLEAAPPTELPQSFLLKQNYPNPFNPATEISYTVATDCRVRLEVYNLAGQKVATLVDEMQKVGDKTVRWNAGSFSSGVYFYRLRAGDFVETRRMMLLK